MTGTRPPTGPPGPQGVAPRAITAPGQPTQPATAVAYPHSRFTPVAGVEVHHEVHGPTTAPAVLLSHHFYGSTRTWRHVTADLGDDHRVVAFDRPGFGLTERPARAGRRNGEVSPYRRATAARIGWGLLDHLDVGRAVLVGSSAGGTNVLEMYRRQPHRVRALVLLSPAITGDVGPPGLLRRPLRSAPARAAGAALVRRLASEVDIERISRSWFDPQRATAQDAEPYQRMLRVDGWDQGLWDAITAERPPDLSDVVRSVDVPTLVVSGDHDRVVAPRLSKTTAAAIPGARFALLEDCGHTPQEERPAALLAVVRDFLDQLPG